MERRRQIDENMSCSFGSVEWLGDRGKQDDRGTDMEGGVKERKRAMERKWYEGWGGKSQRIKL